MTVKLSLTISLVGVSSGVELQIVTTYVSQLSGKELRNTVLGIAEEGGGGVEEVGGEEEVEEPVEGGGRWSEAATEHSFEVEGGGAGFLGSDVGFDEEAEDEGGGGGVVNRLGFRDLLNEKEGKTTNEN
ncbi:hypothetical protein MUK42_05130 [Musa troglodytarum]|uniref:Uncharacterized protein n=1 Tax=Musa troglodytarum TaxID=320322 RepID=A0A9E7K896_9LILI|nr:hypothetical protein MUK42_05130 [Musa troglodytarum]